jgi:hypothetical protein
MLDFELHEIFRISIGWYIGLIWQVEGSNKPDEVFHTQLTMLIGTLPPALADHDQPKQIRVSNVMYSTSFYIGLFSRIAKIRRASP